MKGLIVRRGLIIVGLVALVLLGGCANSKKIVPSKEDNCTKTDANSRSKEDEMVIHPAIYHEPNEEMVVKKPAIYLYPKVKQKVKVSLRINGKIIRSIPEYKNGWSVVAASSGIIDGKYDYLFYENSLKSKELQKNGWVKKGSEMRELFDEILPKLGLNDKEAKQFKEYWLKEFNASSFYEVKLLSRDFLDKNMSLNIKPKPDTLIRVIFNFKEIKEAYSLEEPKITTPKRDGFNVLEWGGLMDRLL